MSYSNNQLVNATINRVHALTDYKIHNDLDKQYEFQKKTILADVTLTDNEKSEAMKALLRSYDLGKITYNEFQMNAFIPDKIPEWIPYNKFQNIKYLTKGGCSEIYIADWIDGGYIEWDSEKKELKRFGEFGFKQTVILKRLENVESANQRWFEEAKSHLTISNKWPDIVQCFGLTQEPLNRNYMLVMNKMDMDLRKYLQQNHNQLSWKERMQIIISIILALTRIHKENAIHRDLHSGNILFKKGTPLEYKNLMKQCWDADPSIRPDIDTLWTKINEINILYQNKSDESLTQPGENNNLKLENFTSNSKLFTSKVHQFENLPEPRNATEEELEVFHSRLYDFYIPNNINDFDKLSNQKDGTSKINSIFEDVQKNDCKGGVIQKQIKKYQVNFDDEDEVHNSPNLHSEEQDKLAIPDGI
ncbi:kinase-like domain-containing protein [Rhizophagus clarus]|uniref:Kinase-like domain-containing protein n=1 Tax=Rhizophagus clarus TaxID=94130 RepID=A0A8H3KVL4_9GLOM|nr:kinase-like domain-containing protein [Rhizophagus clarus]